MGYNMQGILGGCDGVQDAGKDGNQPIQKGRVERR